jgi:hypothetical protein
MGRLPEFLLPTIPTAIYMQITIISTYGHDIHMKIMVKLL